MYSKCTTLAQGCTIRTYDVLHSLKDEGKKVFVMDQNVFVMSIGGFNGLIIFNKLIIVLKIFNYMI